MTPHTLKLLDFVSRHWKCDFLQPMWHQGPCDCGLHDLLDKLPPELLTELPDDLVNAWKETRERKTAYDKANQPR
jgi:hypothetical protein